MNQKTLAARLRKDHYLTARQSQKILQDILAHIRTELGASRPVRLRNFGTFRTKQFHAKIFQDVKTGKIRTLPDRLKVSFKPSKNILNPR
jgi:nucleoid DNA-binding protein